MNPEMISLLKTIKGSQVKSVLFVQPLLKVPKVSKGFRPSLQHTLLTLSPLKDKETSPNPEGGNVEKEPRSGNRPQGFGRRAICAECRPIVVEKHQTETMV